MNTTVTKETRVSMAGVDFSAWITAEDGGHAWSAVDSGGHQLSSGWVRGDETEALTAARSSIGHHVNMCELNGLEVR